MKNRIELIKQIVRLHNFFCIQSTKLLMWDMTSSLWDENLIEVRTDRYYIVEGLKTANDDYDNKTFKPDVCVRYHLRSKEANAYGAKHDAFYKRYLETISFSYEELEDEDKYKSELIASIMKQKETSIQTK